MIWNGHHGRITKTKHKIKLLQPVTVPAHLAFYLAGPKTFEFENAEIYEMLAENIIELAQTEMAATIIFVPKKDRTFPFCVNYHELCNASGTIQRTIDVNLSIVKWQFSLVYLDNIVTFSKTPQQTSIMYANSSCYCTS